MERTIETGDQILKFGYSRALRRASNRIPPGAKMFNWYVKNGLIGVERT